ncbi:hypothetical protein JNUCC0626_25080 [Lentzea sp. JNUCC 0626]|uniref:hypothetical protein n=1 Tax=Lentzea sp. JNUCC 0626 TaxID=3367513 RepID=UPI0037484355
MAARGETQANVEVSTLVVPAWMLRWRAPELALVLGERAVALASTRRDEADRLRAESLVVFAGNRVGRGVRIADRAIDALKAAEKAGEHETGWLLRVELAECARSVGAPLTGFAAVAPVLEAPDVPAELRASALVQASECLVTVGRGDEATLALAEADQLYVADTTLDEDARLLLRGLIRAVQAAQHRRWGDLAAAIGAAREGLDLLSRFSDPAADSGQGVARLTLELALSLMDANRLLDATDVGTPVLERPVRAPSASDTGWLRLALATRVHLPAGRVALAREMLREAAASAERHQLDTLLAESLLALAHVHEVSGELADALTNLRSAHAAERRRARAVYAVRARLAAEFSGVHRQPSDLHQQLASLLRPVEGMQVVTDGVLSAALKQQLRQWRPVQVRKGDGLNKRVRRAAEDMTVEGLSAARQHAADRWRMVQPFGEPDDKMPESVEQPPASLPSTPSPSPSDRTVPASGLIASAGAMVSGRRRAARVAAGEIDDDRPTTIAEIPAVPADPEPPAPQQQQQPPLTVEQERKRKVEQQLMELQREARRQIEEERQARAEQRAQAEREAQAAEDAARQELARQEAIRQEAARQEAAREEAARHQAAREEAARQEAARQEAAREEAARQEAARQEAARQEAARKEAARQEAARQEAAREDALRQELARQEAIRQENTRQEESRREAARQEAVRRDVARQEAAHQEVARLAEERAAAAKEAAAHEDESRPQSESVLDMLKAQGLRAGGRRRRAQEAEQQSETPSWRVEPPSSFSQDEPKKDYFADAGAPPRPSYFTDHNTSDSATRSKLSAAFSRPPATPDFGPHVDDEPAYPLHTPAVGFPAATQDPDERNLPDLDFSSLDFSTPKAVTASVPTPPAETPDPDEKPLPPLPPLPDEVPTVPTPSEIPAPQEPDLLSTTFLSSADVEDDDTPPTPPVQQPDQQQPTFGTQTSFGTQSFGTQPTFGTQAGFGSQLGYAESLYGSSESPKDPAFGTPKSTDSGFGAESGFGTSQGMDSGFGAGSGVGEGRDSGLGASQGSESGVGAGAGFGSAHGEESGSATSYGYGAEAGFDSGFGKGSSYGQSDVGSGSDQAAAGSAGADLGAKSGEPAFVDAPTETGFGPVGEPSVDSAYDFFATESAAPNSVGAGEVSAVGSGDADSAGRPSSRRRPSEMSLADLLAEALVAYETGRRSDEEQLEVTDLAAPDWGAAEPAPATEPVQAADVLGAVPGESEQEKTGPIVPVGVPADSETTGPIRRVRPDGPPEWTLPNR